MRKGVVAVGLLGTLFGLAGCHQAPKKEVPKESPAPKPPHCPDLPELKNITMQDNSIADVRIIRIGETNLYFPAEWLKAAFLDVSSPWPWEQREGRQSIGMTIPDLYQSECPGVVHTINLEREAPGIGILMGKQVSSVEYVDRGITLKEIRSITLSTSDLKISVNRRVYHQLMANIGIHSGYMVPIDSVMLYVNLNKDLPGGRRPLIESLSLTELTQWLATPPNRRDNDRAFTVKIDKVAEQ